MLQTLTPDLDRDRVLLLEILMLTVLVSKFSLLVFKLLLGDEPEIIDSESLIVILACGDFLLLDRLFKGTTFISERFLGVFIVVIIDGIGPQFSFLLSSQLSGLLLGRRFLGGHFIFSISIIINYA